MGINVSTSMGYENRENLKNAAKNILQRKNAAQSEAEKIANNVVYDFVEDSISGVTILKATTQVSINSSLKDTLNYLRAHANDKRKKEYVLGELWQTLSDKKDSYSDETIDFVINFNAKNIFAA